MASGTAVWATSPLTEIWTPASTCTLPLLQYEDGGNVNIWGTGGGTTTIQRVAQGCYPANYFVDDQKVLYSPGACPAGQTMANVQSLSNGATRASCCPSNAPFITTSNFNHCQSPVTSPGTIILNNVATTAGAWIVVQKAIIVEWQSSDLAAFSPASAPLSQLAQGASSVPITSAPSTTTPRPSLMGSRSTSAGNRPASTLSDTVATPVSKSSSPLPTHDSNSSLSTAAKAGIGVGAAVGGIIIVLLVALLWILRKKQSAKSAAQSSYPQPPFDRGSYNDSVRSPQAMYNTMSHEMMAHRSMKEMDGNRGMYRTELE